ncbi:MAG: hypothetical protein KJO54_10490, partial [Gammaproteobacteria bacterium]|nr:hypothetical protein [Gammaproteobacteria bacterium]
MAVAKSVYLIADINSSPTPIETYNINPDGTITFQATANVPALAGGAVGIALDSVSETLFITYEVSNVIQLVDARTFEVLSQATAPGASNLAGIAYDEEFELVYTIDRNTPTLYVYEWDALNTTLALAAGFPIDLPEAVALYGIALDEINDILYVADPFASTPANRGPAGGLVHYYDTATFSKQGDFMPAHQPVGIAVDPLRGFVYTGSIFGSDLLTKYDVNTDTEVTQSVSDTGDGVVGLAVDAATGLVFASRGTSSATDDLTVWNTSSEPFVLLDETDARGDVTGVVIPFGEVSFNPLNLSKDDGLDEAAGDCIVMSGNVTYDVCFDNANGFDATNVMIADEFPADAIFVSATDGGTEVSTGRVEWAITTLAAGSAE